MKKTYRILATIMLIACAGVFFIPSFTTYFNITINPETVDHLMGRWVPCIALFICLIGLADMVIKGLRKKD